ncbi:MAG: hypothetical protein IJQ32_01775 [Paludibacteraceae bacterium]|nr:hypothetical protein [Paludibacteraceae bacterium]
MSYRLRVIGLCVMCAIMAQAQVWRSHLAYNNVSQIAMSADVVYGLSDGSIFGVNKTTEKIYIYDRTSGLHGSDINCIHYDTKGKQLIIGYASGKIDILTSSGMRYIDALYEKDMTQSKNINNVTISGRTAYLSTHFGIQTMDLKENKLVNSYWLRPNGEETTVLDVTLTQDSIYAFTSDSMFIAALADNIVDYTYWKREKRSSRMQPDAEKGKHYQDKTSHWYAGGSEGIIRQTVTGRLTYKPQSPLSNIPYRLDYAQGRLCVVQGGRWAVQYNRLAVVMIYDGEKWLNIPTDSITSKTGKPARDFMNCAVDPKDKNHFYVTSYGTGLYEFRNNTLFRQYLPSEDNTLEAAAKNDPDRYTRVDYAQYDAQGNIWMLVAGAVKYPLICIDAQGNWQGLPLVVSSESKDLDTPGGLIFDNRHSNYKWIASSRKPTTLYLLDDNGTPFDASDDRMVDHNTWETQDGRIFSPTFIYTIMQTSDGRLWVGTEQGLIIIEPTTDYFQSNQCIRPQIVDENGENPLEELQISALCEDMDGNIWVGTNTNGAYVLNPAGTQIIAQYTPDNSSMGSNDVLDLVTDGVETIYIGTGNGLAEFRPHADPSGSLRTVDEEGRDLGSIMQWKLHLSYTDPDALVATPERIYACSSGSLCYVDRADDHIGYMNKTTGLNGSFVTSMAYHPASGNMVIGYVDGRIDLVDKNDYVKQLPDLYMKAGAINPTINSIYAGSKYVYMAMTFGILAVNPSKAEVVGTYYVDSCHIKNSKGEWISVDAEILRVVEHGDTLYAFSDSILYSGALRDNLLDYTYWHRSPYTLRELQDAVVYNNTLYTLQHDSLYRLTNSGWKLAVKQPVNWIHSSDNKLLVDLTGLGVYQLEEDDQLTGITNSYITRDGAYTRGEYWVAATNKGIVRLQSSGDAVFVPDGPNSNTGYFLHSAHGRIYTTIGGRWAVQFFREPRMSIYDGHSWTTLSKEDMAVNEYGMRLYATDPVSIAVDPNDPDHYYIATYCDGLFEYNHGAVTRYGHGVNGSTIKLVDDGGYYHTYFYEYTRTDGTMMDEEGNLWVMNATSIGQPIHVMTPNHQWYGLQLRSNGSKVVLETPAALRTDNRDSHFKWFLDQRKTTGVFMMDDGGTPTNSTDDRCIKRSEFVDQNGNIVRPSFLYCMEQDQNGRMWLGTESGIIIIPETTDLFTSNTCYRIIIPRNDGTGLGDYLLGNEQINCMACDGGNRMWIGTAGSGLFLIEDDTITVAHFTENNSMIPSNNILSLAIIPQTGEVFAGTDYGIASYLSDASEPRENMDDAYAFPNPVRPEYGGSVSITGLMDNSEVNIIDAGGNLVCKTRSHGGTAVWDCKRADGRLATAGIYTALCNTKGGHKAVKIMIIR